MNAPSGISRASTSQSIGIPLRQTSQSSQSTDDRQTCRMQTRSSSRRPLQSTSHASVASVSSTVVSINIRNAITEQSSDTLCVACCDIRRNILFMPCSHVVYCAECYERAWLDALEKFQDILSHLPLRAREPTLEVLCCICKGKINDTMKIIIS